MQFEAYLTRPSVAEDELLVTIEADTKEEAEKKAAEIAESDKYEDQWSRRLDYPDVGEAVVKLVREKK